MNFHQDVKFVEQEDEFSCGPVAIINAQRFFNVDPIYIRNCRRMCHCQPLHADGYQGTKRQDIDPVIQKVFNNVFQTVNVGDAVNWLKNDKHCAIVLYSYLEDGVVLAHYTMIHRVGRRYLLENDDAKWRERKGLIDFFSNNPPLPLFPNESYPLFWLLG